MNFFNISHCYSTIWVDIPKFIIHFKANIKAINELTCIIFRELALVLQYIVVLSSTFCNRLPGIPNPIPRKCLRMPVYNIGNFSTFLESMCTTWKPQPKKNFDSIGRNEGLRISHDIRYKPASGLCLSISLHFLSAFHNINDLIAAAAVFRQGAPSSVVKTQALYDALLGVQGQVKNLDLNLQNPIIQPFMLSSKHATSLRQFVFDDLEKQNIEINPDIYTLVLELDAIWHHKHYPSENKYDSIHTAIVKVLAETVGFENVKSKRIQEKYQVASELITLFDEGSYLIQFANHTVALIKAHDSLAILDPRQGLAILNPQKQHEVLNLFLEYYGANEFVSFNAIQLFKKKLIL